LLRLLGFGEIGLRFVRRQAHLLDDRIGASHDPAALDGISIHRFLDWFAV
jgi:hypothetical protein